MWENNKFNGIQLFLPKIKVAIVVHDSNDIYGNYNIKIKFFIHSTMCSDYHKWVNISTYSCTHGEHKLLFYTFSGNQTFRITNSSTFNDL